MKKSRSLFFSIVIFISAQLSWFLVIGLWIYKYVTSNMIFEQVGDSLSPQLVSKTANILALIGGLFLMVTVSVGMSLIFRYLTIQLKITRMYDNFIASVTHELKSPLSSIQLYLETMTTRKVPDNKIKEFLGFMVKDTERVQNLIDTILNVSGLEQKKYVSHFQVMTAGPAIKQLMQEVMIQYNLPKECVNISGSAPYNCVIDLDAMRMVLDNLVNNAIKYSNESPKITLNLSCVANHIRIEIKDHGIGISHRDQKKLFQKFQRIYRRDTPSVKGTGLGLFWVSEIIKTHGGEISVFSEGQGKGTAFHIELPVYQTVKRRYVNRLLKITQKLKKTEE